MRSETLRRAWHALQTLFGPTPQPWAMNDMPESVRRPDDPGLKRAPAPRMMVDTGDGEVWLVHHRPDDPGVKVFATA